MEHSVLFGIFVTWTLPTTAQVPSPHTDKKKNPTRMTCIRGLIFLLFLIAFSAVHKVHGSENHTGLFSSSHKSLLKLFKSKNRIDDKKDLAALAEQRNHLETTLQGSMIPVEDGLEVPHFLRHGNHYIQQRQDNNSCTCEPTASACNVTCVSLESRCGWTCVHVTEYAKTYYVTHHHVNYSIVFSTSANTTIQTYDDGCEILECACFAKAAKVVLGVAAVIAVALGVPSIFQPSAPAVDTNEIDQISFQVGQFLNRSRNFGQIVPEHHHEIPVDGLDFPNDGCGDRSVRFADENCYPLLRRGPCADPYHWVTLNPIKLQGRCTPRLCGRGRVFVGRDGLCHDVNDPNECQGGRRLYYTAYGDPICDCPIGQYPFPNAKDDCVPLFSQGPCPTRHVVAISPQGRLGCTPAKCQSIDNRDKSFKQLAPTENGRCYALGSRGPCPFTSQLLGYDIFKRRLQCVNIRDPSSPYFFSPREDAFLDRAYNQIHPEYDVRVSLTKENLLERSGTAQRKQDTNTIGVFQLPSPLPHILLNPCRPGARRGLNYKCTNPLVSDSKAREVLQVVRSAFNCPANSFLQATGRCVDDERTTNCGSSYRFTPTTRQCRSIF